MDYSWAGKKTPTSHNLICSVRPLLPIASFISRTITHNVFRYTQCVISSVLLLLRSPGIREVSAAAAGSKPVLPGLRPDLRFALSPRGGGASLARPAPGSGAQLVPGQTGHAPAAPCRGPV